MKKIKIIKLVCDNFRCFTHKKVTFSDRTVIQGRNGLGKSTIYNAVMWVLFDKDMNCNSAPNVRQHGNSDDVSVECTFDIDGNQIVVKKVQKQLFATDRATSEQTFKGNENSFFVNEIPKSLKDYKAYISENFCDEETFLMCTNASAFFKLDTKKRRSKLMSLVNDVSDMDVIATDKAFEPLSDLLSKFSIDEILTMQKAIMKPITDECKKVPIQISALEQSKHDVDIAELELWKNSIVEQGKIPKDFEDFLYKYSLHLNNVNTDCVIERLKAGLRMLKQKEADEVKTLDLLDDFIRKKLSMVADKLNSQFAMVKWKLLEEQVNGNMAYCCKALVNGSDVEKVLNDSDCLLAYIDIMQTFQRLNGLQIFTFLDRAECINADRIPNTDSQLICFKVSEDKEMNVERI